MTKTAPANRRRTKLALSAAAAIMLPPLLSAIPAAASTATTTTFLSGLTPISVTNGWGPAEKDRSNGEALAGDGRTLTLNAQTFSKGLGVHAGSDIRYTIPPGCTTFSSTVGVDDYVGKNGSVVFQVFDGTKKVHDSGIRTGSSSNAAVSVPVTPGGTLRLVVTDAGNGEAYDHADWANARLTCAGTGGQLVIAEPVPATSVVLAETFTGLDGTFVSQSDFWGSADRGLSKNAAWLSESGTMLRSGGQGKTSSDYFRMWTRANSLANVSAEMSVTFNGFTSGSGGWHGVNLWLHKQMCTPVPSCSAVNDPHNGGGNSGYALDFLNRDGSLTVLKKVPGDTRGRWPVNATSYAEGGTYYTLAQTTFRPTAGRTYRFAGKSVDNGDGSTTLQIVVDDKVLLQVRDDGRVGGPRLGPGRVGFRSDFAHVSIDDVVISR